MEYLRLVADDQEIIEIGRFAALLPEYASVSDIHRVWPNHGSLRNNIVGNGTEMGILVTQGFRSHLLVSTTHFIVAENPYTKVHAAE